MTEHRPSEKVFTSGDLELAYIEADRRMKLSNGHSYVQILKCRCIYCNRSPKQKGKCSGWFHSFCDRLSEVLYEQGVTQ